ncbi:hypothetical protein TRIP_B50288 [uncultured Desulfatiglans sp.]|nr:hypothetical protein TRIP_B50288 [uncultured Desulfatiglans sp.]
MARQEKGQARRTGIERHPEAVSAPAGLHELLQPAGSLERQAENCLEGPGGPRGTSGPKCTRKRETVRTG